MIFDTPLKRSRRPGGGNDSQLDDLELTKAPDIASDLDAIDRALAEAEKVAQHKEPRKDVCGCW
jgi:hypothetical protein